MLKHSIPPLALAVLLLSSGATFAQHVEIGPGGVRVNPGHDEHREQRVIEEHRAPVEHHERQVVREHGAPADHHDGDHD